MNNPFRALRATACRSTDRRAGAMIAVIAAVVAGMTATNAARHDEPSPAPVVQVGGSAPAGH